MSGERPTGGPPDASMTLITTMMRRPLDPGYAAAAERRTAAGLPPSTSLRSPLLLAATLVIGLVVGIAAYNLTATTSPRSAARADLIGQIEHRRADVDRLATEAASLQAQVSALESTELGGQGSTVARTRELARSVGTVAMHGRGIQVTLDDAPRADAGEQASGTQADQGRVYARDLQFVVNSLWEAGAEAVSINGKRLTSLSAIRFAGSAIIVGYRPLARPYVVTAIGNPRELPTAFADGPGGSYVSTLRSTFGIRADTSVVDDVTVPAAVGVTTRYAKTGDTGATATPTPTTTPGATSTTEDDAP